jgi:hypothetical protein
MQQRDFTIYCCHPTIASGGFSAPVLYDVVQDETLHAAAVNAIPAPAPAPLRAHPC